ncbi:MAG: transcription antitermination factor NusB [Pseudomonadota bacterium]
MMKRRKSRELAFEMFYALELSGEPREKVVERFSSTDKAKDKEVLEYALQMFNWAVDSSDELSDELSSVIKNWSLDRLSKVDKSLIYLACAEIMNGGTPSTVVIDEFVEMAKTFGDANSPAFVNGVIDSWHKKG